MSVLGLSSTGFMSVWGATAVLGLDHLHAADFAIINCSWLDDAHRAGVGQE